MVSLLRVVISLALCLFGTSAYATVNGKVDRTNLQQGETLVLMLSITDTNSSYIDLTPLEESFEILDRDHEISTAVVQGKIKSITQLMIRLVPKTIGKLEVPALTVAGESTQPIKIEVFPENSISASIWG